LTTTDIIKINKENLTAWEKEKESNNHGMAYLSDRVIKIINDDIEYLSMVRKGDKT